MKIYFLSSQPCALTINGAYFGITDTFARSAELSLSDRVFVEFSPEGALPFGCFLTEELSSSPPKGFEVYLLKDGVALYARDFTPRDFLLRPIMQKREGERLATVYSQGELQLCIQSEKGYFNAYLPPSFETCELFFHNDLLLLKSPDSLGVFNLEGTPLLLEKVLSYEVEGNTLTALLPLSDRLQRRANCRWTLSPTECTLVEFTLVAPKETSPPEGLLAYAFFESVLLKANYADFLSDELRAESEQIVEFLGDFTAVTLTSEPNVCGLIKKKGERLFEVTYYAVTAEKGKITDVRG